MWIIKIIKIIEETILIFASNCVLKENTHIIDIIILIIEIKIIIYFKKARNAKCFYVIFVIILKVENNKKFFSVLLCISIIKKYYTFRVHIRVEI